MTPNAFIKACQSVYSQRGWQAAFAKDLGVDGSSVRRWASGAVPVPGPVRAFLKCMIDRRRLKAQAIVDAKASRG